MERPSFEKKSRRCATLCDLWCKHVCRTQTRNKAFPSRDKSFENEARLRQIQQTGAFPTTILVCVCPSSILALSVWYTRLAFVQHTQNGLQCTHATYIMPLRTCTKQESAIIARRLSRATAALRIVQMWPTTLDAAPTKKGGCSRVFLCFVPASSPTFSGRRCGFSS